MLRYAISGRALYPGSDAEQQAALLKDAARWAAEEVDFVQLREKNLDAAALADLARQLLKNFKRRNGKTKLLVNSRVDVAVAAGADGVHLTSGAEELTPEQVRAVYTAAGLGAPLITVSCHTVDEVRRAREAGADGVLFAPVFGKMLPDESAMPGVGLEKLRETCDAAGNVPVLALGGVTWENAAGCMTVGAAGVAGIRLFQGSAPAKLRG